MVNIYKTRFHTWTSGGGGGGGTGMDIKVKVSANDTTTDYLSNKLVSTDGTATFTILNPAANEQYDISVGGVQSITVAQGQNLIATTSVVPNKLYLVTDAYGNTAQIFLWGVSTTQFDEQGYGKFTNVNTLTPIDALLKYNVSVDKITEVYLPMRNVRVTQSWNNFIGASQGNSVDRYPFNPTGVALSESTNVDIRDCILGGSNINSGLELFSNCIAVRTTFTLDATNWSIARCEFYGGDITLGGNTINILFCSFFKVDEIVVGTDCEIYRTTFHEDSYAEIDNNSDLINCFMAANSQLYILDNNQFNSVNIGQGKVVNAPAGYDATNSSIEDLDSTFEVFLNPDIAGVMDMAAVRFAGIVRIGTSGVPAAWDLKTINNFPTDHIFCIIPADSNTVDVYDAGAGGTNIYLNVAAVVTYDGDKDDTLVVRSGLNSYTRLFQIGGWQAPSA
jgi:hypothetical protein